MDLSFLSNHTPDTTTPTTKSRISDELFAIDELAEKLRWSKEKLIRLHVTRKGPPRIKVGKSIYYHWPTVLEWLLTHQQTEPRAYKRKASKA